MAVASGVIFKAPKLGVDEKLLPTMCSVFYAWVTSSVNPDVEETMKAVDH